MEQLFLAAALMGYGLVALVAAIAVALVAAITTARIARAVITPAVRFSGAALKVSLELANNVNARNAKRAAQSRASKRDNVMRAAQARIIFTAIKATRAACSAQPSSNRKVRALVRRARFVMSQRVITSEATAEVVVVAAPAPKPMTAKAVRRALHAKLAKRAKAKARRVAMLASAGGYTAQKRHTTTVAIATRSTDLVLRAERRAADVAHKAMLLANRAAARAEAKAKASAERAAYQAALQAERDRKAAIKATRLAARNLVIATDRALVAHGLPMGLPSAINRLRKEAMGKAFAGRTARTAALRDLRQAMMAAAAVIMILVLVGLLSGGAEEAGVALTLTAAAPVAGRGGSSKSTNPPNPMKTMEIKNNIELLLDGSLILTHRGMLYIIIPDVSGVMFCTRRNGKIGELQLLSGGMLRYTECCALYDAGDYAGAIRKVIVAIQNPVETATLDIWTRTKVTAGKMAKKNGYGFVLELAKSLTMPRPGSLASHVGLEIRYVSVVDVPKGTDPTTYIDETLAAIETGDDFSNSTELLKLEIEGGEAFQESIVLDVVSHYADQGFELSGGSVKAGLYMFTSAQMGNTAEGSVRAMKIAVSPAKALSGGKLRLVVMNFPEWVDGSDLVLRRSSVAPAMEAAGIRVGTSAQFRTLAPVAMKGLMLILSKGMSHIGNEWAFDWLDIATRGHGKIDGIVNSATYNKINGKATCGQVVELELSDLGIHRSSYDVVKVSAYPISHSTLTRSPEGIQQILTKMLSRAMKQMHDAMLSNDRRSAYKYLGNFGKIGVAAQANLPIQLEYDARMDDEFVPMSFIHQVRENVLSIAMARGIRVPGGSAYLLQDDTLKTCDDSVSEISVPERFGRKVGDEMIFVSNPPLPARDSMGRSSLIFVCRVVRVTPTDEMALPVDVCLRALRDADGDAPYVLFLDEEMKAMAKSIGYETIGAGLVSVSAKQDGIENLVDARTAQYKAKLVVGDRIGNSRKVLQVLGLQASEIGKADNMVTNIMLHLGATRFGQILVTAGGTEMSLANFCATCIQATVESAKHITWKHFSIDALREAAVKVLRAEFGDDTDTVEVRDINNPKMTRIAAHVEGALRKPEFQWEVDEKGRKTLKDRYDTHIAGLKACIDAGVDSTWVKMSKYLHTRVGMLLENEFQGFMAADAHQAASQILNRVMSRFVDRRDRLVKINEVAVRVLAELKALGKDDCGPRMYMIKMRALSAFYASQMSKVQFAHLCSEIFGQYNWTTGSAALFIPIPILKVFAGLMDGTIEEDGVAEALELDGRNRLKSATPTKITKRATRVSIGTYGKADYFTKGMTIEVKVSAKGALELHNDSGYRMVAAQSAMLLEVGDIFEVLSVDDRGGIVVELNV